MVLGVVDPGLGTGGPGLGVAGQGLGVASVGSGQGGAERPAALDGGCLGWPVGWVGGVGLYTVAVVG
eukprot:587379-Prymnesium_polylepis.1